MVVGLGVLALLVTLPHSLEDFVYGIPARFGLDVLTAGILLAAGYALHLVGMLLAARGSAWGYGINLLVGLGWLVGAVADHLSEVLYAAPYRAGLPSKVLEVGIMVVGAALAVVSALALWRNGRGELS